MQGDLTAFEEVLAPDIVWVGLWPGQLCRNRAEVLEMLTHAQAESLQPTRRVVRDEGDLFVVDPHLDRRAPSRLRRSATIVVCEVRGYPDRGSARGWPMGGRPW